MEGAPSRSEFKVRGSDKPFRKVLNILAGRTFEALLYCGISIIDPNQQIPHMLEYIKSRPETDLVVYGNHSAIADGFLLNIFANRALAPIEECRQNIRTVSKHSTDKSKAFHFVMHHAAPFAFGYDIAPVISTQHLDMYPDATEFNKENFWDKLINYPRPMNLVGFPEGNLSEDRALQRGRSGYARIMQQRSADAIMLPVGIVYQGHRSRNFNHWSKVNLTVGQPIIIDDNDTREPREVTDIMMRNLARTLPKYMRGVYS